MIPVTCLIIDDERLARAHLRRLAQARTDLHVIGEAAENAEALSLIKSSNPQLLLLDIRMPGGGGFALLEALENPPAVIFVTAHDAHAIRAFEVNAVDYLLKPVSPERFGLAIDRAIGRLAGIESAAPTSASLRADDTVLCEIGHSGHFVAVDQILAIEAQGNYTRLTTLDGTNRLARQTLKEWGHRLPPDIFIQVDRSHILNRNALHAVEFTGRSARVNAGERHLELALGAAACAKLRGILGK